MQNILKQDSREHMNRKRMTDQIWVKEMPQIAVPSESHTHKTLPQFICETEDNRKNSQFIN